jgi:MFS family permease
VFILLPAPKYFFRALRNRNYFLFFCGQSISVVGTWMQSIAVGWLVYRLTNSAFLLGLVAFAAQAPTFFIAPFAGVFADRHNRRRILLITQTLAPIQASILAALVMTHAVRVWHIVVLSVVMGIINSFDIPVRHAFTVDMVGNKEDLSNAIALNSSMINAARLIGPSLAGIIIASSSEGVCFLVNAVSYLPVILSLWAMSVREPSRRQAVRRYILGEIRDGVRYAVRFSPMKTLLGLVALVSMMGVPYQILMPVFARDIFLGGPRTLGFLVSVSGIGALCGAFYLAGRASVLGLTGVIAVCTALFGCGIVAFSQSRLLALSMCILAVTGFGMMVALAASNTLIQTIVDEDKRGRMMSFYTMAFMGMVPFGSLLSGSLAHHIGAPATLVVGGVFCIIASLVFFLRLDRLQKSIRPMYVKKGIIPEVADGLESASFRV